MTFETDLQRLEVYIVGLFGQVYDDEHTEGEIERKQRQLLDKLVEGIEMMGSIAAVHIQPFKPYLKALEEIKEENRRKNGICGSDTGDGGRESQPDGGRDRGYEGPVDGVGGISACDDSA
jgi:hypothetical protein